MGAGITSRSKRSPGSRADAEVMCTRLRAPPLTPGVPLCPRPQRSRTRSLHRAGPRRTAAQEAAEQPSIPGVAKRRARSGSAEAHRDHGRGQRPLEVAGEDGRRHREGEVPLDYRQQASPHHHRLQTSVNVSTMTVTASQTRTGHGGGDGAAADAGLWTNEHHSNDLANVHGPALCLGARACIAAFLDPHLIVSLLTFLVMLAHSSTSVPSEKGEQLSRRSLRTSR